MELTEKNVRKIVLLLLLCALGILTFFILQPILLSILAGLLLAYMFTPLHKQVIKVVKKPAISAAIVSLVIVLLVLIPLWFLVPPIMQQVFEIFRITQDIDVYSFIKGLFPTASEQFLSQIVTTLNSGISKGVAAIMNYLINFMFEFPTIALHFLLVAFVFFYTLKDQEKLKLFASQLSPFNKNQEKVLVKQFRDMTDSIIYGQILVGVYQGIVTGIGLLIFGVPNALILTIIATLFSVVPIIGPAVVYLPATLFIFQASGAAPAIIYLIYNLIVVSSFDNVIRAHLVARRTDMSQVFIIIGMVGGLFVFGFIGLVLGPLIIAYFITVLRAYRDKTISSLFVSEEHEKKQGD
jgi:predicted PurR-regulated permease PerM